MRFHWTSAGLLGWILYESTGEDGIDRGRIICRFPACRITVAKVSKIGFPAPIQLTRPTAIGRSETLARKLTEGLLYFA